VVAVPNKSLEQPLLFFGSHHGNEVDKFKETNIETMKASKTKTPLLKDATINMECELTQEIETGDHYIFVGEVVVAHINPDKKVLLNMKKIDNKRVFGEF